MSFAIPHEFEDCAADGVYHTHCKLAYVEWKHNTEYLTVSLELPVTAAVRNGAGWRDAARRHGALG